MTFLDAGPEVANRGNVKLKLVAQDSKQFIGGAKYPGFDPAGCCEAEYSATQSLVLVGQANLCDKVLHES